MPKNPRPLSPHLQIYRLKLHTVMSGLHRITGLALGLGGVVLAWWAAALAGSKEYYEFFIGLIVHPLGRLVLFGFTFALLYHAINGLRHIRWDFGTGFAIPEVKRSGLLVIFLTVVMTIAVWVLGYMQAGKL